MFNLALSRLAKEIWRKYVKLFLSNGGKWWRKCLLLGWRLRNHLRTRLIWLLQDRIQSLHFAFDHCKYAKEHVGRYHSNDHPNQNKSTNICRPTFAGLLWGDSVSSIILVVKELIELSIFKYWAVQTCSARVLVEGQQQLHQQLNWNKIILLNEIRMGYILHLVLRRFIKTVWLTFQYSRPDKLLYKIHQFNPQLSFFFSRFSLSSQRCCRFIVCLGEAQ